MPAALQNLGTTEVIIIAVILVVLFGGKRIPELSKGLGEAVKTFRDALTGHDDNNK